MTNGLNSLEQPELGAFDGVFHVSNEVSKKGTYLIGFGFDGTACFRKGTKDGPNAIREVSYGIETYSPYLDLDLEDREDLFDLGNLPIGKTDDQNENWKIPTDCFLEIFGKKELEKDKIRIITLGGEHSISYAPIKTYLENYDDLVLIHLDAHADLRDGYLGYHYSHASIIRRALDHFKPSHQLIQYGIRSGTRDEYDWMNENRTNKKSLEEFIESVKAIDETRPVYLTLDLDYFDPAYLPGTGTPEAGGETFHSYIKLMKVLRNKNFVGADIVELSPTIDPTGNSDVFAAKVLRETILALS